MSVQGIESILPASLNYKQMKKSLIKGDRKTVKLFPATNTNTFAYNGNRVIQFNLPSGNFLDVKNTRLCFEANATGTNAAKLAFNNHIESVFNKVEVLTGDSQSSVELLQDYNINAISDFMYNTTLNYGASIANVQEGFSNDIALRKQWASQTKGYAVRLMGSGVFNCALQYLPLKALANNGGMDRSLVLLLTLENPQNCMINTEINTETDKDYVIKNMFLQLELIDCPSYEAELSNKIAGGMVIGIPYKSSEHWVNTLQQGQTGDITFQMNSYFQLAEGFKTIFKNGNPTGANNIDFTNTFYKPNGMKYYQVQVGNKWFPTQLADISDNSNAVQMNETLKYYNKGKDVMDGILNSSSLDSSSSVSYLSLRFPSVLAPSNVVFTYPAGAIPTTATQLSMGISNNQGWSLANLNKNFRPSKKGYYRLSLDVKSVETNTGANASTNLQFSTTLINSNTLTSLGNLTHSSILNASLAGGDIDQENFTLEDIVYLDGSFDVQLNVAYVSGIVGAGNTFTLAFTECTLTAELVDNLSENWISNSYVIAQTFKTWYDNESYMRDQLEYFLDGMDTTTTNQIVFRFAKSNPDQTPLNLYQYLNYVGSLVITNKGVSIVK